jgi:hypothetical protein
MSGGPSLQAAIAACSLDLNPESIQSFALAIALPIACQHGTGAHPLRSREVDLI